MCTSEALPFAKTGGLADVCGSLPLALEALGIEVTLFLPRYQCVEKSGFSIESKGSGLAHTVIGKNIDVYFVESEKYFDREALYGDIDGDYADNLDRYQFFSEKVLKLIKTLGIQPEVIHCNDWQTALIPVLMKEKFKKDLYYQNIKTVLTIHNLAYQGVFPLEEYKKIGIKGSLYSHPEFEFYGKVNLLKAGILYSDRVTTVSQRYAKEILTTEYGCGLEDILRSRDDGIEGILNGLDYEEWSPKDDELLLQNYSIETYAAAKQRNKSALQKILGLKEGKKFPLFGFVGRLSHQKGVDLIIESMEDILRGGLEKLLPKI
jgi:starch synthase